MGIIKLSEEKEKQILKFLDSRFKYLEELRDPLDRDILEGIELYNDIDKENEALPAWKTKGTIAYLYAIVQTIVARMLQSLYGKQNYLKVYMEKDVYKSIEKPFRKWLQSILDGMNFKYRARDFLEEALIQRTTWLHLRPVLGKNDKLLKTDFNVYQWFDVWCDTGVKEVEESDFFIRKVFPLWKIKSDQKLYPMNVDKIKDSVPPDAIKDKQIYKSKNKTVYYDPTTTFNTLDKVETKEYYGVYDLSDDPDKPDYKYVLFVTANDTVLLRAETIDLKTKRKILIFPIRPIRQANSIIGKSIPQIAGKLQKTLNFIFTHLLTNYKLNTGLMFKYRKNSNIDMDELFSEDGNAVGYEDSPDDVGVFETPNTVQLGTYMLSQVMQLIQQLTGAVDSVMGVSTGGTATETKAILDQAMFKFSMMAENVVGDILKFVNYVIILQQKYNLKEILMEFPEFVDFFKQTEEELELNKTIDLGLNDLTMRRDIERAQYINLLNALIPLIQSTQANQPEFLRTIMNTMEMENIETIMEGAKTAKEIQQEQMIMIMKAQQEAQAKANAAQNGQAPTNASSEEEAMQVNS